eukprot:1112500-Prorocentrum_minimum.AAC.1
MQTNIPTKQTHIDPFDAQILKLEVPKSIGRTPLCKTAANPGRWINVEACTSEKCVGDPSFDFLKTPTY